MATDSMTIVNSASQLLSFHGNLVVINGDKYPYLIDRRSVFNQIVNYLIVN